MSQLHAAVFGRVPEWLLKAKVSDRAKVLYAVLTRYADQWDHKAWPSRKTLAGWCSCSPDSVDRAVKELVDAGALIVERRADERLVHDTNIYLLVAEESAVVRRGSRSLAARGGRRAAQGNRGQLNEAILNEATNELPHADGSDIPDIPSGGRPGVEWWRGDGDQHLTDEERAANRARAAELKAKGASREAVG